MLWSDASSHTWGKNLGEGSVCKPLVRIPCSSAAKIAKVWGREYLSALTLRLQKEGQGWGERIEEPLRVWAAEKEPKTIQGNLDRNRTEVAAESSSKDDNPTALNS